MPTKLFAFFAIMLLSACGHGQESHRQTIDSINQIPAASPEKQIPGTPGPSGSDSTRPTPAATQGKNDSAR